MSVERSESNGVPSVLKMVAGIGVVALGSYFLYPMVTSSEDPVVVEVDKPAFSVSLQEELYEAPATDEEPKSYSGLGVYDPETLKRLSDPYSNEDKKPRTTVTRPTPTTESNRLLDHLDGKRDGPRRDPLAKESPFMASIKEKQAKDFMQGVETSELWDNERLAKTGTKLLEDIELEAQKAKPIKVESVFSMASIDWVIRTKADRDRLDRLIDATDDPEAKLLMAKHRIYAEGNPVGFQYAYEAAKSGHPEAMALVGEMYGKGVFIPQDRISAYGWLTVAEAFGVKDVSERRAELIKDLDQATADNYQYKAAWLLDRLTEDALEYAKGYAPAE